MNRYMSVLDVADRAPQRSNEVVTHQGGIAHSVDIWTALHRFLILGTEKGSFYQTEQELTVENVSVVRQCLDEDFTRAITFITNVSETGRAPKNDPALLALAMASIHPDLETRQFAFSMLSRVARIGTHLLHFVAFRKLLGGRSNYLFRKSVKAWFTEKPADDLAFQVVKYPSRDGWAMRDLLRLAHPDPETIEQSAVMRWVAKGEVSEYTPILIQAREFVHNPDIQIESRSEFVRNNRLFREALPTEWLNDPAVWDALLPNMGLTAIIRNLGKMTAVGLLQKYSEASSFILDKLSNEYTLQKARVHPIAILAALKVYEQGHGIKGSLSWNPSRPIINALNEAFYLSFGSVIPTGKRILMAVDVSASMIGNTVNGMEYLNCRDAAAAMALVTMNVEPNVQLVGFDSNLYELHLRPSMRLDEVLRALPKTGNGTYGTLPIAYAYQEKKEFDAFISISDMETNSGIPSNREYISETATSMLYKYRGLTGIDAKHVAVSMVANRLTLADPNDTNTLQVVGFDTATPTIISDFVAGVL